MISRRAAAMTHDFGDGHLPGEFVFVPATADAEEDEGWLIGFVINTADETTTSSSLTRAPSKRHRSPRSACRTESRRGSTAIGSRRANA